MLVDSELDDLYHRSVGRLITAEIVDVEAFKALYAHLRSRAESLKHEPSVPKQVLASLLDAHQAIEVRSEHLPEAKAILALAHDFSVLLGIIAKGESPSERVPGVPRII